MAETRHLESAPRKAPIKIHELKRDSFDLKVEVEVQPEIRPSTKFAWPLLVSVRGPVLHPKQHVSFSVNLTNERGRTVLARKTVSVRTRYINGYSGAAVYMPPIKQPGTYYLQVTFGLLHFIEEHRTMVIIPQKSVSGGRLEVCDSASTPESIPLNIQMIRELAPSYLDPFPFRWHRYPHVKFDDLHSSW